MLLWLVVAYLVVSIGIGLYAATRVHNARDYITAGRNLPMIVVLAAMIVWPDIALFLPRLIAPELLK